MHVGVQREVEVWRYHVPPEKSGQHAKVSVTDTGTGMGAGKAFDCIRSIQPSMPVILSSRYAMNDQANAIMQRGCNGLVQKPFNINEPSERVQNVLDQTIGSHLVD